MDKKKAVSSLKGWALLIVASSLFFVVIGVTVFIIYWRPVSDFAPMRTEELRVIGHTWGFNNAFITLSAKNTGISSISVNSVQVNDATVAESNLAYSGSFTGAEHTLDPGESGTIIITHTFISGIEYEFYVISARGYKYRYVATAP